MRRRITSVALLLAGCGASTDPRAIGQRGSGPPSPPRPAPPSTELQCVRPDEVIGVCGISHQGVMAQAAGLPPGAGVTFQLDEIGRAHV